DERCQYPFSSKQKDVCINPYHYRRVESPSNFYYHYYCQIHNHFIFSNYSFATCSCAKIL
ncbi:hypothetical protein GUI00_19665, partial [Xanthomonas citri pv. citri]|nr:hypothetical protein [Xanthomonas citri pv. citri]